MSISKDILNLIIHDYNSSPDNNQLSIADTEIEKFWNWFMKNAEKYDVSKNNDESLIGEHNIAGRCFGNSQNIALKNNKSYHEGFMKSKMGFVLHAFNTNENKVEDYTALSNKDKKEFIDDNGNLPTEYYGVKIPNDFIDEHNSDGIKNNDVNISHLIGTYFKSESK